MMLGLSLVAVMALAFLASPRPAGATDAGVAYTVDFKGYTGGSVLEWLGRRKFVAKQDADNKHKIVLSIHDEALVLEAKQRAFGLLLNETDVPGPGRIRIEWGVDAFPQGVSYEKGIRSERSLKPKARAVAVMSRTPTFTPSFANTVLHDHRKASRRDRSSQPSDSLVREVVVPGRVYGSGESVGASTSLMTPASSAAAAVTTLNVEPGG